MNKQLMAVALAAAAVIAAPAHATSVALAADGSWNEFDVDSMLVARTSATAGSTTPTARR